ncbi:MAG: hypothetical protein JXB19_03320 [Bacteroidales bacterium]|nr:hypothetical protein [Bacteroidales bacterium]
MIKSIVPILNILVILVLQILPGNISVQMDVPSEVKAGSEFEITLTLKKGNLESFSRFQQEIPAGLLASSDNSANADFTFSDSRVRLIWLRLPESDEFTATYRIKVDERLKGTFNLSGQFSYIEKNERKSVDLESVAITIVPSETIDPSLIVDINDFGETVIPYIRPFSEESANIACVRQKPYPAGDGTYIVNVLVNKNDRQQFAKIEEIIPDGYTASSIDPKEAIFTFKDQMAKFLWMNMPLDAYFTVSYRLIPRNQAVLPPPEIDGSFSFLVDEKTIMIDIVEKDVDFMAMDRDEIYDLITQALSKPVPETTAPLTAETTIPAVMETTTPADKQKPEVSDQTPLAMESDEVAEELPGIVSETTARPDPGITAEPETTTSISYFLEPEQGVYYRIQVAAGHKPVNISRYFRNMKLDMEVRMEEHEGWQKYSVGSFDAYREARDYRVHIWNTTLVKDAFVTAYNSGSRITVQEALMITEQKWYQ